MPTRLKPWKQKIQAIQAILALERPKTVKQLHSFIGAVLFYWDMFPKRSHILSPLTALVSGKGPLKWTPERQQAFAQMKAIMAQDAFLRYPDHNKPFHIYCDASDLQLGAVIIQDDALVAFYSHKLNSTQKNYFLLLKPSKNIAPCYTDVQTSMSTQTIKITLLPIFKPNMSFAGGCS
jgi:RNase H-like domain found in reverse transcriptase